MSKSKALGLKPTLSLRVWGSGRFQTFQVFDGAAFFSKPANTEKLAWQYAYQKLVEKHTK